MAISSEADPILMSFRPSGIRGPCRSALSERSLRLTTHPARASVTQTGSVFARRIQSFPLESQVHLSYALVLPHHHGNSYNP